MLRNYVTECLTIIEIVADSTLPGYNSSTGLEHNNEKTVNHTHNKYQKATDYSRWLFWFFFTMKHC